MIFFSIITFLHSRGASPADLSFPSSSGLPQPCLATTPPHPPPAAEPKLRPAHINNKDNESPLPKYKRDLVQKMKVLRQELSAMQPQAGHCRLEVSRTEIFEVSK